MLKKVRKSTIPTKLSLVGQGTTHELDLVYNNIGSDALQVLAEKADAKNNPAVLLIGDGKLPGLLQSWESEYTLDDAGINEAEADLPGLVVAVMEGYNAARVVTRAKN